MLKDVPDDVLEELSSKVVVKEKERPYELVVEYLKTSGLVCSKDDIIVGVYKEFDYKLKRVVVDSCLREMRQNGRLGWCQLSDLYWYPTVMFLGGKNNDGSSKKK